MLCHIRKAVVKDVSILQGIACRAYAHYCSRMDRDPAPMHADFATHIANHQVFVASDGERSDIILGYAVMIQQQSGWLLDNIAADPDYQGKGIGKQLLQHCEAWLIDLNVAKYSLYTNVKMHESLAWYLSLGFVETERRMEDGFHRVYMERSLTDQEARHD